MQRYDLTPAQRECPVCYSSNAHVLWVVNSDQAAQHFVRKEADRTRFAELAAHIETLWGRQSCEVVRCDDCEFCFSHPYVAGDEAFYTLACDRGSYPTWRWEYQLTYEVLKDQAGSHHKLLEIGAGDGAFVRRVGGGLIRKENILCTEFSATGRERIRQHGFECFAEHIIELTTDELEGAYDFVCMFQVLEHMDQLDVLFQKLNWISKKGASLFIAVPNPKTIQFSELNGGLLDMPPNHIGRWNRSSFEAFGRRWGFTLQNHAIEDESMVSIVKTFLTYRFLKESQQAATLANRIRTIKNRSWRRAMQVVGVALSSMRALPALSRIRSDLGMSQWVHLVKSGD